MKTFLLAGLLLSGLGAHLSDTCARVTLSDGKSRVELSGAELTYAEQRTAFQFTIRDTVKLRAAANLIKPTITFCYKGKQMVAYGSPLVNSAIPKGAEAFYPLGRDNKVFFGQGTVRILLVKAVTNQRL